MSAAPRPRPGLDSSSETVAGRPSIAELRRQFEDLLREIRELPYDEEVPRSGPKRWDPWSTADHVRIRLQTWLNALGLGKAQAQLADFLYGLDSTRQLCLLAEPVEFLSANERLEVVTLREELFGLASFMIHSATEDRYSRRAHELLPSEPPGERRGRVELSFGEPFRDGEREPGSSRRSGRRRVATSDEEEDDEGEA